MCCLVQGREFQHFISPPQHFQHFPRIPSSGTHLEKVGVAIWAPNRKKEMPYFCWVFPINDIMDIAARHQHQQRYTERLEKWPFIELFDGQVLKHLSNVDLLWQKVDKYLRRTKTTQATSKLTLVF